jgi:hypothetical protein
MTLTEARNAIVTRLIAAGYFSTLSVDNQFRDPGTSAIWARIVVLPNTGRQITLGKTGARRFDTEGVAIIQVFTRANTGTNTNDGLAEQVRDLFDGVSFDGVWTFGGAVRTIGSDGAYWQQNVEIQFRFEKTR